MSNITTFARMVQRHEARLRALASGPGSGDVPEEVREAARMLLSLHEGRYPEQVAAGHGVTKTRVVNLRLRFLQLGLGGLFDPAPMSKSKSKGLPPPWASAPAHPQAAAGRPRQPEVSVTITEMKPAPGSDVATDCARLRSDILQVLARPLPEPVKHRLRALLIATDPTLSLTEAAQKAGVGKTTMAQWWRLARQRGINAILNMNHRPPLAPPATLEDIQELGSAHLCLLQQAGVDSVPQLARQHPGKLLRWLEEVNREERLCRELPTEAALQQWIVRAQGRR